jgi:DNA-binding PucR family transcriptional regulator
MVDAERGTLTSTMLTQRLETVSLVLEGAPISIDVASVRLGFDLRRTQVGVVFWREPGGERTGELERAADALGRLLGAPRPLTVAASAVSLWAWYALDAEFDASAAAAAVADAPGLRLAVGSVGAGVDGFRRTHFDALTTQRLMMRSALQVAVFADVEVVSLLPLDDETVHEFVERTLGDLASADPTLRETLRVYLREELSPTRAARALYTHRNTVLNRLARAQALLPAPLAGRHLPVALALEVVHWLGSGQREIRRSKPSAILA